LARVEQREGEGVRIPIVVRSSTILDDGSITTESTLSLQGAPVPARRYVATMADVVRDGERTLLAVGQHRLGRQGLRSLVVIHISPEGPGGMSSSLIGSTCWKPTRFT